MSNPQQHQSRLQVQSPAPAITQALQGRIVKHEQMLGMVSEAQSLIETADKGLEQIKPKLQQISAIVARFATGEEMGDVEKQTFQDQFEALRVEIDVVVQNHKFEGYEILGGILGPDNPQQLRIGTNELDHPGGEINLSILPSVTSTSLGLTQIDLSDAEKAAEGVVIVEEAIAKVSEVSRQVGDVGSQLSSSHDRIDRSAEKLSDSFLKTIKSNLALMTQQSSHLNMLQSMGIRSGGAFKTAVGISIYDFVV